MTDAAPSASVVREPGAATVRVERARLATLVTVWLAAGTGLSLAALGLLREPARSWVLVGAVGLLALAATLAAALYAALTPWLPRETHRTLMAAHAAAAVLSLVLVGPVATGEWQTWAWVGGTLAGTAPVLLGRRPARIAIAASVLAAVAIAALGDGSVAVAALIVASVGLTAASMCLLPARLWTLLSEAQAGREAQGRLAAADERLRFARDVHDVLGHRLTVIALQGELAARLARVDAARAAEAATEVQRLAQSALTEVRQAVHGYRAVDLRDQLAAIELIMRSSGVRCTVSQPSTTLPTEVAGVLAAVVREASTNVLRHSRAEWCTIKLTNEHGHARLVVSNDGTRPGAADPRSSGLLGVRERLAAAGGTLDVRQDAGVFSLQATIALST